MEPLFNKYSVDSEYADAIAGWITLQEWMLNMQSTPVVCQGLGYRRTTVKKEDWQNNSSNC